MQVVAGRLAGVGLPFAFVGGSIVGLLLDDSETPARPTDDVDVILEMASSLRYSEVEARIRKCGFDYDMRPKAPKCRWVLGDLTVDIMPTDGDSLGLNTLWFKEALASATEREFGHVKLRIISPPAFLATKYVAFLNRGKGDLYGSLDLEDFMAVIDGRANIAAEVDQSGRGLRAYVIQAVRTLLESSDLLEALPAFLPARAGAKDLVRLQEKLAGIAALAISKGGDGGT